MRPEEEGEKSRPSSAGEEKAREEVGGRGRKKRVRPDYNSHRPRLLASLGRGGGAWTTTPIAPGERALMGVVVPGGGEKRESRASRNRSSLSAAQERRLDALRVVPIHILNK